MDGTKTSIMLGFDCGTRSRTGVRIMAERNAQSEFVQKACSGDRAAFDALAKRIEPRIRAFVQSRLRGDFQVRLEVAEIVQDTLVRAHGSIHLFRGEDLEAFVRWILGIARIALIKALGGSESVALRIPTDLPGSAVSPSRALRREERFERLQGALEKLSDDHRAVIILSRIDGLPIADVAERLGRSSEATKKLLGRALRELREKFGDTESLGLPDRGLGESVDRHNDNPPDAGGSRAG